MHLLFGGTVAQAEAGANPAHRKIADLVPAQAADRNLALRDNTDARPLGLGSGGFGGVLCQGFADRHSWRWLPLGLDVRFRGSKAIEHPHELRPTCFDGLHHPRF